MNPPTARMASIYSAIGVCFFAVSLNGVLRVLLLLSSLIVILVDFFPLAFQRKEVADPEAIHTGGLVASRPFNFLFGLALLGYGWQFLDEKKLYLAAGEFASGLLLILIVAGTFGGTERKTKG